jgi:hypothetical protein
VIVLVVNYVNRIAAKAEDNAFIRPAIPLEANFATDVLESNFTHER